MFDEAQAHAIMRTLEDMPLFIPSYVANLLSPTEERDELLRYITVNTSNAAVVSLFLIHKYPAKETNPQVELFKIALGRNSASFDSMLTSRKNLPSEFCDEILRRHPRDFDFFMSLLKQKHLSPQSILDIYNTASHYMTETQFKSIAVAALLNPNMPDVAVEHLSRSSIMKNLNLLLKLSARPNLPVKAIQEIVGKFKYMSYKGYYSNIIKQANVTPSMLAEIVSESKHDQALLIQICGHPAAPLSLLKDIVNNTTPPARVALAIAGNASAPQDIIEKLASSLTKAVSVAAVKNLHENFPDYQDVPMEWLEASFSKK